MGKLGIPTAVHYHQCLHVQPVFKPLEYRNGDFPVAERVAREVISLPMHPFLGREQQDRVVDALLRALTEER
jgi:UDP-2-acetamido-2-deoxy-ribo-hexuluronate aminotransferase